MEINNRRQARFPDGQILDGVEAEMSFNQKLMKGHTKFSVNGIECPHIALTSKQSKAFANYALIKKDLKFCRQALNIAIRIASDNKELTVKGGFRAEQDELADLLKGMYISFVVTYAKCYTKADGRKVKLEAAKILENTPLKERHLELMEQRHSYIAHGGKTSFEQVEPIILLHPNIDMNVRPQLMTQTYHVCGFGVEEFEKYLELVDYVDEQLNTLLEKKAESVFNSEVNSKSLEELYEEAQQ